MSQFTYTTFGATTSGRWIYCRKFDDLEQVSLPDASRVVVLQDENLPTDRAHAIQDIIERNTQVVEVVGLSITKKNVRLLDLIAFKLASAKPDLLYVVGGGTLCDVGLLAAALANPTIKTVLLPTTVIAMCDASVGGLSGVNRWGVKNVWSTRHIPVLSLSCGEWLETLPIDRYMSGFAEVVKMLFLRQADEPDLDWLNMRHKQIIHREHDAMLETIEMGARLRAQGASTCNPSGRDLFGHNIGHALELVMGVPHGEAVAKGMILEAAMAVELGLLHEDALVDLRLSLERLSLPRAPDDLPPIGLLIETMMRQRFFDGANFQFWLPVRSNHGLLCSEICLPLQDCTDTMSRVL